MKKQTAFTLFALALSAAILEVGARVLFETALKDLEKARQVLAGETPMSRFALFVAQPYLVYALSPNRPGIGPQGARGAAVSLEKTPGTTRILFLGGSTVFDWGVPEAERAFPAVLGRLLSERGHKVEIVNAGLHGGTTAEELTHYLFKWRYFRPDVVVLHTGANDPTALTVPDYQPDYGHWRAPYRELQPLPSRAGRALLRSRLLGLFFILLAEGRDVGDFEAHLTASGGPPIAWYPELKDAVADLPASDLAAARNVETLLREAKQDGARTLFVPFRPSPASAASFARNRPAWKAALERTDAEIVAAARRAGAETAPYTGDVVSPENYLDGAHTNAPGAEQKARFILPYLEPLVP